VRGGKGRRVAVMASKEVEQGFAAADWEVDDGVSVHPLIGYSGDTLSMLFYPEMRRAEDPMFEVLNYLRNVAY
jgi:hypothetical protein